MGPHTLVLEPKGLNIPLSTYLGGTEAVHAHLGYERELLKSSIAIPFRTVEVRLEGEEKIDGLRCLKIRVVHPTQQNRSQRFHRVFDDQPDPFAVNRYLWLAPERNYLCIQEESSDHRTHVDELRQVRPGLWFPAKVTVHSPPSGRMGDPQTARRTEMVCEKIDLAPHHEDALFRDVAIPADLPVFTIKDGRVEGSNLPEPVGGDRGREALEELGPRVAEQERKYHILDVAARVVLRQYRARRSVRSSSTNGWGRNARSFGTTWPTWPPAIMSLAVRTARRTGAGT